MQRVPVIDPNDFLTVGHFVREITSAWQTAVASIVKTGRLLSEAKQKLAHGQWQLMFEGKRKLPFGSRTAQRLMSIAEHPVLSNPTHASHLPASWATLYEMTELPAEELEALLADGTINAETQRHEVADIVKKDRALGLYTFSRVTEALNMLIDCQERWPDPDAVARRAYFDLGEAVGIGDLGRLLAWLTTIHAACARRAKEIDAEHERAEDTANGSSVNA